MLLKGEIPSITKLDTSAALTTAANKIPNVNDLVIKNKYFTTSDYNKFADNVLDVKITAKKLVN